MGWLNPTELTGPTTINGLEAVSNGGETYIIKHTDSEFLLLENRQWKRWDAGVPGKGLVVYHVDYDKTIWASNTVNNAKGHFRFDLVHADNLDYEQWDEILIGSYPYAENPMLHNKHLSTSPYPWTAATSTDENRKLTDDSTPATTMFNANSEGSKLLSKAITNIQMTADGLISFDFMGGTSSGISAVQRQSGNDHLYNIMGQRMTTPHKGLYIKNGKKYIRH